MTSRIVRRTRLNKGKDDVHVQQRKCCHRRACLLTVLITRASACMGLLQAARARQRSYGGSFSHSSSASGKGGFFLVNASHRIESLHLAAGRRILEHSGSYKTMAGETQRPCHRVSVRISDLLIKSGSHGGYYGLLSSYLGSPTVVPTDHDDNARRAGAFARGIGDRRVSGAWWLGGQGRAAPMPSYVFQPRRCTWP